MMVVSQNGTIGPEILIALYIMGKVYQQGCIALND